MKIDLGHIILAVGNNGQFRTFVEIAGVPELGEDARYKTNADRVRNREALVGELAEIIRMRSTSYWLTLLETHSIPSGPINNIAEVFDNPQLLHRQMRRKLTHPVAGEIDLPGSPMNFSRTPSQAESAPPALGQHTVEVLKSVLGYDDETIASLQRDGIV